MVEIKGEIPAGLLPDIRRVIGDVGDGACLAAEVAPGRNCSPKSPLIRANPAMEACRPVTVTVDTPLATFSGALVDTDPTATVSVVSRLAPVLL